MTSFTLRRNWLAFLHRMTDADLLAWRDEILHPVNRCGYAIIAHGFKWPFVKHELERRGLAEK